MDISDIAEKRPLLSRHSIPADVRDNRSPCQRRLAVYFILASTLFERLAFYSLIANIVLILNSREFNWNSSNSITALYIFTGTSYISTFILAIISDSKLNRANTVIIGFILYLIGYTAMILILYDDTRTTLCPHFKVIGPSVFHENCAPSILIALVCTGLGVGAVQANMIVFGAEQLQDSKIILRYFDKYIVAVNIGGIIAILAVPYIQMDAGRYYHIGFIVVAGMLFLAAVLFIIGRLYYIHIEPYDTVTTMCIPVCFSAFRSWCHYKINKRSIDKNRLNSVRMGVLSTSVSVARSEESISIDKQSLTFLDYAKAVNNGRFHDRIVDNVKSLRRALVVFVLLIPYWLIYDQLETTFPLQARQMRSSGGQYVSTLMTLGDPITIIIGIFILNLFIYKYVDNENPRMEIITKFIIGLCFASITMSITGIVEGIRQNNCDPSLVSNKSNLSLFVQLPQTIGMGLAELFATTASYEFAYFAAPRSGQSLFMSLHFCSTGISSIIGTIYIDIFRKTTVDINFSCLTDLKWQWTFYTYFFILAGLQLVFIIIFIICQNKFQIIKINPEKLKLGAFI